MRTNCQTISIEIRRCALSDRGRRVTTRHMWYRFGNVVRETKDFYIVQWDGLKSAKYFAKDFIDFVDNEEGYFESRQVMLPPPFEFLSYDDWNILTPNIAVSIDGLFQVVQSFNDKEIFDMICLSNDQSVKIVFKYWNHPHYYKFRHTTLRTIVEYYHKLKSDE